MLRRCKVTVTYQGNTTVQTKLVGTKIEVPIYFDSISIEKDPKSEPAPRVQSPATPEVDTEPPKRRKRRIEPQHPV